MLVQLSFVSWTDHMWGLQMGFYWSSLFFLFASPFSHSSTLFYFKTDESSEQHLKLSCLFFFFDPRPVLFMFLLLSQHTCALLTHTHTRISVDLNQRFVKVTSHTQQDRLQRPRGGSGQYWWYILYTYTQRSRGRCLSYVWKQNRTHQDSFGPFNGLQGSLLSGSCSAVSFMCLLRFLLNGTSLLQLVPITEGIPLLDICSWYIFLYVVQLHIWNPNHFIVCHHKMITYSFNQSMGTANCSNNLFKK